MPGTLYVVATPIGNLDDITVRAVATLRSVGLVAAEDTRRTALLLKHFGLNTRTTSLHEHNENEKIPRLLRQLAEGTDIALVSDAGTPVVADPGQRLIARAAAEGVAVIPIPGASAVMTALSVAGYPADTFFFGGFAPAKANNRRSWLNGLAARRETVVFFESPHRIEETLADIAGILGERPIIIARELTKLHEQIVRTTAREASAAGVPAKGEFTIVLGPFTPSLHHSEMIDDQTLSDFFYRMTESKRSRRDAIAATAKKFGLSPNDVYTRLERLKLATPS